MILGAGCQWSECKGHSGKGSIEKRSVKEDGWMDGGVLSVDQTVPKDKTKERESELQVQGRSSKRQCGRHTEPGEQGCEWG